MDFKELIKLNKKEVKSIIRLITNQENEDLEQEVYIKAWKNTNKYEEKGSFKSWIVTIAKNLSKDYLKSSKYKVDLNSTSDEVIVQNIADTKITPENKLVQKERQKAIINAIESLKPKMKEVILLCEIDGYTYEEAAKKIGCPVGTIKSRIFNAKKELAEKLEYLL